MPLMGIQFVADPSMADICIYHAGTASPEEKKIDVLMLHGLYWSDIPHASYNRSNDVANQRIMDAARRAKIITVPSNWVAEVFKRDMRVSPFVIGHGIDVAEWNVPAEPGDYVLWNKNRPTDVCDPTPAWKMAERGIKVVSTFGPAGKLLGSLSVTGQMPFEKMKPIIESAMIYLATTPETFGIGTLEAMICGVPVLGYDWCGTSDLVKHKETGWLVQPGDVEGLIQGYVWLKEHRTEIGANARAFAKGFDWPAIMEKYLWAFAEAEQPERQGVSVVITNYNYGKYVKDAIHSCLWQRIPVNEIIVVDDGSTDNSLSILEPLDQAKKIKLIIQENQGVAAARNNGISAARYPLITCLDADDMIGPEYVASLRPALERDRGLGVAYSGVKYIDKDSKDTGLNDNRVFSWEIQAKGGVPPSTCIPSGSMFRKSMWERCGGYRQKYAPGEDTEFWVRGLSLGFTAELVTEECHFWYRGHSGSASRTKVYVPIDDNKPWMRDKKYPAFAPSFYPPAVHSYLNPVVSVDYSSWPWA